MRHANTKKGTGPLRIAGYVRISSQRQASEGDSLIAQENEIVQEVEFRKRREGCDIGSLKVSVDAGKSTKDQNHPSFNGSNAKSLRTRLLWSIASNSTGSHAA